MNIERQYFDYLKLIHNLITYIKNIIITNKTFILVLIVLYKAIKAIRILISKGKSKKVVKQSYSLYYLLPFQLINNQSRLKIYKKEEVKDVRKSMKNEKNDDLYYRIFDLYYKNIRKNEGIRKGNDISIY